MGFFKSLLSLLGMPSRPRPIALELSSHPRPIALELSALGKLPPELIIHIASFLPPDSASSFSLCCRPIYFSLGTKYLKVLGENEQPYRYKFLMLLERELPNYITCYYCEKLHAISEARRHLRSNRCYTSPYLPCWKAQLKDSTDHFIHPEFSITIFQMAMKIHRQGHDCSKLLNLLSLKTSTNFHWGYIEQHTALAQIVAGSLLLRDQIIYMMPPTQPILIPRDIIFFICPHFGTIKRESFDRYGIINQYEIAPWTEPNNYQNSRGIMQCKYCFTEFRIDFKNFGECGNAMFLTRWKDLGEGRSPLDPKWKSHLFGHRGQHSLPVEFDQGSICAAFEGKKHSRFEFDSLLTLQNKEELFRKIPCQWPKIF